MANSGFSLGRGIHSISGKIAGRGPILNEIYPSRGIKKASRLPWSTDRVKENEEHEVLEQENDQESNVPAELPDDQQLFMPYRKMRPIKPLYAERSEVGSVKYSIRFIKNHEDLKQMLGLSASICSRKACFPCRFYS